METSDTQNADFVHYLLSPPAKPVADQRRSPSIGMGSRAKLRLLKKGLTLVGSSTTVMVQDMSQEGIGILHESWISPGDEFILEMPGTDHKPIELRCSVQRCERGGIGRTSFLVGASFKPRKPQQVGG